MSLETTECISINNKNRIYTDCMEFSLLRFIQLLGYCPKEIGKNNYSNYNKKVNSGLVTEHINMYPKIYPNASYYFDKKSCGVMKEQIGQNLFQIVILSTITVMIRLNYLLVLQILLNFSIDFIKWNWMKIIIKKV